MSTNGEGLGPLAGAFAPTGLFATWLDNNPIPDANGATTELKAALAAPDPATRSPLWQDAGFATLLPAEFRDLPGGPGVVVTGQQPGFLGGPLLTLFKIATAIRLAQRRTAAGKPTVPVFWSGDADDDLAEALAPVGWDDPGQTLFRSPDRELLKNPATQRAILADVGPELWAAPAVQHLAARTVGHPLTDDLLALLRQAIADKQIWGAGQAALLTRIFAGTGLVVIRGHDAHLHEVAAPFYGRISGRLAELADLARARGSELISGGFSAQISERSLSRPLFRVVDGRREPTPDVLTGETGQLRPGVLLRSPLQDWLLQPAAVVVGPGELAYLRQLDPLYKALEVPRSALVPRMCGWVLPDGDNSASLAALLRRAAVADSAEVTGQAEVWADEVIQPARLRMAQILSDELGLTAARATALADKRARRFRKGLVAMFRDEGERREQGKTSTIPQWALPAGQRQERTLGLLSAIGLWGDNLIRAILVAADEHLAFGEAGEWQEMVVKVPEGTQCK